MSLTGILDGVTKNCSESGLIVGVCSGDSSGSRSSASISSVGAGVAVIVGSSLGTTGPKGVLAGSLSSVVSSFIPVACGVIDSITT